MSEPDIMAAPPVVLIVEDEPLVRALAADVFEEEGFEVIEAATADFALTVLNARDDVSVLFTDVDMPGRLNGLDLAHAAKSMCPEIVVIVVSGKLPSGFSGVAPEARFIPKPYRMTNVVQMIRNVLDEQPGRA